MEKGRQLYNYNDVCVYKKLLCLKLEVYKENLHEDVLRKVQTREMIWIFVNNLI